MPQNVVFIVCFTDDHEPDYAPFCFRTWSRWCRQNGALLCVLDRPPPPPWRKANWQKFTALAQLEAAGIDYDQVAVVDADTMIRWDAPDFFELTGRRFAGVVEYDRLDVVHGHLQTYGPFFPGVPLDLCDCLNGGLFVVNRDHRPLLDEILRFHDVTLGPARTRQLPFWSDQLPMNLHLAREGWPVTRLPKSFNLTHMHAKGCLERNLFVELAWVWHFNGFSEERRRELMEGAWQAIRHHYPADDAGGDGAIVRLPRVT
jgi:hypothetical protein